MKDIHDILMEFSQEIKQVLGDKLTKIILYGSYARGEQKENSDIDIMVLTTYTDEEIEKIETKIFDIAFDFEMKYFLDISVIIKNEKHFNYWLGSLPFYDNVEREGVVPVSYTHLDVYKRQLLKRLEFKKMGLCVLKINCAW